jgi:hypothetical protein
VLRGTDHQREASLEEILAERIAGTLEELVERSEKVPELMDAEEAAVFLRLPYDSFRRIAPSLPRHMITPKRAVYSRRELLQWVLQKPSS